MRKKNNVDYDLIRVTVSRYFKSQGIKQREAAARLGVSLQCVSNMLSSRHFTEKTAEAWAKEFGFRKDFLLFGTGDLFDGETDYDRLVRSNEEMHAALMRQRSDLERYRSLYGPLPVAAVPAAV